MKQLRIYLLAASLVTIFLCVTLWRSLDISLRPIPTAYLRMNLQVDLINTTEIEEPYTQEKVPLIVTKNYTVPQCSCKRLGFDVESLKEAQQLVKKYPHQYSASFLEKYSFDGESTCSNFSTQRGAGQKVVSYSFYSSGSNVVLESRNHVKYLMSLHERAAVIKLKYPGWNMRIYHSVPEDDEHGNRFLCHLYCDHPHVDLCQILNLPIGNLLDVPVTGRMWRFAVLGDPTVSTFLVRDADSWIIDREVAAVKDWLASDKDFHVMRDFPAHRAIMMAGLWGGKNKDLALTRLLREKLFEQPRRKDMYQDQKLLARIVWPKIKNNVVQHDSYSCHKRGRQGARSFPVQRVDGFYCGYGPLKPVPFRIVLNATCPVQCRPADHKDWIRC